MSHIVPSGGNAPATGGASALGGASEGASNLADVLERVLDKGIVIVGDIRVNLLDIELLTIKLRLIVAGVDTARRIGINWWERDPWLTGEDLAEGRGALEARIDRLERQLGSGDGAAEARERDAEIDALRDEVERLRRERAGEPSRGGDDG